MAYSSISHGWLAGEFRKLDDLPQDDYRRMLPRFKPEVFDQSLKLVETVEQIAKRKDLTMAQVALIWVARQGVIPILGSPKLERVIQICSSASLTDEDMAELQKVHETLPIAGERYIGAGEDLSNA